MKTSWMMGIAAATGLALMVGCEDRETSRTRAESPTYQQDEAVGGAGTTGQPSGDQARAEEQQQVVVGRVASVSGDEMIVQDNFKQAYKLELTDDTQIIGTGEGLSAQPRLLQGIDVRVSFTGEGEEHVAQKIEVLRADTGGQEQQQKEQRQ